MEISPSAINSNSISISKLNPLLLIQQPCRLLSHISCVSSKKPNSPFHNLLSYSYFPQNVPKRVGQNWREQLTNTWALSDETTAAVDSATKPVNADSSLAVKKKATDVHADLKGTSIFLVGMNSAMKSGVGKLIADVLRYYYFDSDSVVEEAAGEDSSGRSFKDRDESGFHDSETEVLKQLSSMGRLVVNAGNGAVQSAPNLALLRHGISIWIDVPLDMMAKGVITDNGQSMVSNISSPYSFSEALSHLTRLYEDNRAGYATADVTISVQNVASKFGYDEYEQVTAEDMALEVLKEIEKLTRVKKMMEEAGKPF